MSSVKLTKVISGTYKYSLPDGTILHIFRNTERDSGWFGDWCIQHMNESRTYTTSYSDPIPTLAQCRLAVQDMIENPQLYKDEN